MKWIVFLALATGCATAPLDPIGTITANITYGPGNCGASGGMSFPVIVSQGPNGRIFTQTDPDVDLYGGLDCDDESCDVDIDRRASTADNGQIWSITGTLAIDGAVSGTGLYVETDDSLNGVACKHTLTMSGTFSGML